MQCFSVVFRDCTAAAEAAERAAVDARSSAKLTDAKAAVTAARGRGGGAGAFARLQVQVRLHYTVIWLISDIFTRYKFVYTTL
jgi:hypothetical protein